MLTLLSSCVCILYIYIYIYTQNNPCNTAEALAFDGRRDAPPAPTAPGRSLAGPWSISGLNIGLRVNLRVEHRVQG